MCWLSRTARDTAPRRCRGAVSVRSGPRHLLLQDVSTWSGIQRRELRAAQRVGALLLAAAAIRQPGRVVGPPGALHSLGLRQPVTVIGRVVGREPVGRLRVRRRVDHGGDVPAGGQHEPDGRARFTVEGGRERLTVAYGPKYSVAVVYAPRGQDFLCFEPMSAITNAFNLAHDGLYQELQSVAPGVTWKESFWMSVGQEKALATDEHR